VHRAHAFAASAMVMPSRVSTSAPASRVDMAKMASADFAARSTRRGLQSCQSRAQRQPLNSCAAASQACGQGAHAVALLQQQAADCSSLLARLHRSPNS